MVCTSEVIACMWESTLLSVFLEVYVFGSLFLSSTGVHDSSEKLAMEWPHHAEAAQYIGADFPSPSRGSYPFVSLSSEVVQCVVDLLCKVQHAYRTCSFISARLVPLSLSLSVPHPTTLRGQVYESKMHYRQCVVARDAARWWTFLFAR